MIFGNFAHFRAIFEQTERTLISGVWWRTWGPLTIMRNTPEMTMKFKEDGEREVKYRELLLVKKAMTLDENGVEYSATRWLKADRLIWGLKDVPRGGDTYGFWGAPFSEDTPAVWRSDGVLIASGSDAAMVKESIWRKSGATGLVQWFEGNLTQIRGQFQLLAYHKPDRGG